MEGILMLELIKGKTASLKPSDSTDDEEVGVLATALPPLEVGISNFWEPGTELRDDKIEGCLPIVKWNLEDIAYRVNRSVADVARYALHIGIDRLWTLPGIGELREIKSFVHHNSQDADDRRWFDHGAFDLRSSETLTLRTRLLQKDVAQCASLASAVGLRSPLVRQLAIMAGLIQSQNIPVEHSNQMVETLRRFREWIEDRLEKARRLRAQVGGRQRQNRGWWGRRRPGMT
jgi:hypothetical protein